METSEGLIINQSQISNNSREVSALLNDIQDLHNDIKEAQSPPEEQPNGELSEKNDGFGNDGGPVPSADWSTLGSQDRGGGNIDISSF